MNTDIALSLAQDGLAMSAIYTMLAVCTVLLFSVTRVLFVPQGDFLSYGAMTLGALGAGTVPGTLWIVLTLSLLVAAIDGVQAARRRAYTVPEVSHLIHACDVAASMGYATEMERGPGPGNGAGPALRRREPRGVPRSALYRPLRSGRGRRGGAKRASCLTAKTCEAARHAVSQPGLAPAG